MKIINEWHKQLQRYGDFYNHYEVETDADEKTFIEYALKEIIKRDLPSEAEWEEAEWEEKVKYGGEKYCDMDYYFNGYYTIEKTEKGFIFEMVHPYDD